MFGNIDNLPNDDKRNIVNNKLDYLSQLNVKGSNLGKYELAIKRRHGAKKLLA